MDTISRVQALVEPLVHEAGAGLYDLEFSGGTLRITVERPGGVDMGVIGSLTRSISRVLDEHDPIAGQYTLEVSSPGLERTLRRPDHFVGARGVLVAIKTRPGTEGDRRVKGTITAADDATVTIALADGEPGATRVVAYDDIERARTVFEWGPAPKPGGPRPRAAKAASPAATASTAPSAEEKAAKP